MAQHARRIVTELMDEPHVAGHRVSVRRIRALVEERDQSAQSVAGQLDLDVADVYRALAYYHDHPAEMHDVERRRNERIDESCARGATTGPDDL